MSSKSCGVALDWPQVLHVLIPDVSPHTQPARRQALARRPHEHRDRHPAGRRTRHRTALPLPAGRARRARLDALPGLEGRHRRGVGVGPVAARPLRQERQAAARADGRPPRRAVLRRPRARPGRAGHDVDARAAADDEHDGAGRRAARAGLADRRVLRRPDPPLHDPGVLGPSHRLVLAPARRARLAPRARHVGDRGADPPLPDEGARRAAADLPAVLRPLHPHGPGRQLDAGHREAEVRRQAQRPHRRHARLPASYAVGARRRGLRRRRGQHAVAAPRGLPHRGDGDREHPRHPARDQGAHRPAAALAAARRRRGRRTASPRSPARAASRSRCTPTPTTRTP